MNTPYISTVKKGITLEQKTPFFVLLLLGAISGILSSFFYTTGPLAEFSPLVWGIGIFIGPGFIFGCFIGSYFYFSHRKQQLSILLKFIPLSMLSYLLAYIVITVVSDNSAHDSFSKAGLIPLFFAGIAGASLLLWGFRALYLPLSKRELILLVLFGGFLSFSIYFSMVASDHYSEIGSPLLSLMLVWQSGMAGALGWIVVRNDRKEANKKLTA